MVVKARDTLVAESAVLGPESSVCVGREGHAQVQTHALLVRTTYVQCTHMLSDLCYIRICSATDRLSEEKRKANK